MTVADVFVDNGKARADGHDQRRAVRVIQKPANGEVSPVRFPSVAQDWDAAAEHYEIQRQKKQQQEAGLAVNKLGAIAEEPRGGHDSTSPVDIGDWSNYTPNRTHRRDIPVSSVEKDDEIPVSPSQPPRQSSTREFSRELNGEDSSAPQGHRMGSQELGDSPRSSRAATPKKPTPTRRDSAHSLDSTTRSGSGDARDFDSPALQLRREHTYSVSPQKKPAPEVAKPNTISLDEVSQSEDDSGSSDENSDNSDKNKEIQDKDGDVAMGEESIHNKQKQSPAAAKQRATAVEIPVPSSAAADSQSRKRKNSVEHTSPNKEPRLDRTTPPAAVTGDKRLSNLSPGTPRFSPSGRRLGGTESFSGVARRLSFSERPSEPPSHGLGLGITRSPPKKPSVLVDLSQNSTQSGRDVPQSTPILTSSAPTARRGSATQNISTPANVQNSADKLKNLHSALRKDASVDRNSARRSVSFAGDDEVHITASQPAPTSTPMDTAKPSETGPASEKRRASGSMVFPPGVSMERIAQLEREAEEKIERRKNERAEFEEKIKAVEKDKTKSEYAKKLKMAYKTWQSILANEKNGRKNRAESAARLENELKKQRAEIKNMEDSMGKPSSQDKAKKPQNQKSVKSQADTKKDNPALPKPSSTPTTDETKKSQSSSSQKSPKPRQDVEDDTSVSPKPTASAPATDQNAKSPVSISGWNAINAKSPTSTAKSAAPTANGTGPKSTPKEPTARTVATRTLSGSKASKPASIQSQNSTASDEIDLPAMKVQARTNANTTKKAAQEPVEVSSSSESEQTSSDESSESESESESESDSSDDETKNKKPSAAISSSLKSPQKANKAASPPSAQRTTKSPAPSSQQTSQAPSQGESWRWPRASQTPSTRFSLKGIKSEVASQAQAQAAAKAAPQKRAQPRKDLFSPPDSDSDETESESESESSSSSDDSDNDSEDNKGTGANGSKRSNSPGSVADAGDIMSSGQVRKLRPARLGGRA